MGYTVIIDILAGIFIGGILLTTLQQINFNTVINLGYFNQDYLMQVSLMDLVSQVERDFKRIGYTTNSALITSTADAIILATDTCLTMVGDFDNNGSVDSVKYYIGAVNELANTTNPRDRVLYRQVGNSTAQKINMTVTYLKFNYYDSFDAAITTPVPRASTGSIATIMVSLRLESPDSYKSSTDYDSRSGYSNERYSEVYWRQLRVTSKNLKNR